MTVRKFESRQEECLIILMEECGELIQETCKMIRRNNYSSADFIKEVGDVITMIKIAGELGLYNEQQTTVLVNAKLKKLQQWSNLFD